MWLGPDDEILFSSKFISEMEKSDLFFLFRLGLRPIFWRKPKQHGIFLPTPPQKKGIFLPFQGGVSVQIFKSNLTFCLTSRFYLLCPPNKRNTVDPAEGSLNKSLLELEGVLLWRWQETIVACFGAQPRYNVAETQNCLLFSDVAHFLLALHRSDRCP